MADTHDSKRLAKNTLFLYLRMLLTMAIGIFTTRVVLATLGETDYGVYNVVGGFVGMFAMISASMAAASQRFLSFEIGKKESGDITSVFSTSVLIHCIIAAIILIVGETIGIWFINNKLNFPQERYYAANWVFQFSLLTFIVNVLSVPYNAALIAFEKMKTFAYVSIVEAVLKLLIVYLLAKSPIDTLIFYAILQALIAIVIRIIYNIYVNKKLKQCRVSWKINRSMAKEMLSFAGWNMFGATAGVANDQGINVVLNIFFGTAVNAARGITMQVQSAITSFVSNFQLALSPQIIKTYSAGEKNEMLKLIFQGARFSFLLMMILSLPVIISAPFILDLWLKEVPEYTVVFIRISLIGCLAKALSQPLSYAMHASGKVRNYQVVCGITSMLCLPVTYFVLRMGCSPESAFVMVAVFALIFILAQLIMLKPMIGIPIRPFLVKVVLRSYFVFIVSSIIPIVVKLRLENDWISFITVCLVSVASVLCCSFLLALDKDERLLVITKIKYFYDRLFKG